MWYKAPFFGRNGHMHPPSIKWGCELVNVIQYGAQDKGKQVLHWGGCGLGWQEDVTWIVTT